MEWWAVGLMLFGGMLLLLFLGINIPFALGLISVIGIFVVLKNPVAGFIIVANEAYHRGTSFLILAVPMFIFLAEVVIAAGISRDAYNAIARYLCRVPAGLAVATMALATGFAALTGSSLANAAIIGRVSIPEMERHGYAKSLAGAVVVAGGVLGILIPPSIPLIFYALFAEESVAKLFMAGILPGLLISSLNILYIITRAKLQPQMAPPSPRVSFLAAIKGSYRMIPFAILITFMFGGFYLGLATPSEIGGVAVFMAFVIAFAYRRMNWDRLKVALLATTRTTVMLMWILIPALAFGVVLAYGKVPQNVTAWVTALPVSPIWIMVAINIFLLILGCILETGAIVFIIWPMLITVAEAMGWNLIWFAIILVIQMELGQITPPVGIVLFGMKGIAPQISVGDLYRGVLPFVFILVTAVALVIAFPQIALWLPSMM